MANRDFHDLSSGLGAALYQAYDDYRLCGSVDLGNAGLAFIGGVAGGRTPDWIEPATDPNHRGSCHSAAALGADLWILRSYAKGKVPVHEPMHILARSFVVGHAIHLTVDGCTPRGIPVLGVARLKCDDSRWIRPRRNLMRRKRSR